MHVYMSMYTYMCMCIRMCVCVYGACTCECVHILCANTYVELQLCIYSLYSIIDDRPGLESSEGFKDSSRI